MDIRLDGSNPSRQMVSKPPKAPEAKATATEVKTQGDSLALSNTPVKAYEAPAESLWYTIKKKVALALSGIEINHTRALTKEQANAVLPQMKPGDVLLRRVDYTSANMVIPGFFGHAAVYVGNNTIIDATTHGVRRISVQDFFAEGDHAMVIRPKNLSEDAAQKIAQYAEEQVGKVYDFDLDNKDDRRFTCTELVEDALKAGTGKELAETNFMGGINPDSFKNQNFEMIWTSTPDESKMDQ
jgi:uncharacterized protein YycO